ncbi:MAG: arginine--tRNA ligase [Deltaproteobacteria bacterium]|nr:MAG: arginine--tRNA ligase [Deltaproteobacteria bacterium]TDJ07034.1 MAG: arginine--tRNA ligase [Deltaproteobacteria bacterium]
MREQVQKLLQEAAERVVREIHPSQLERLGPIQVVPAKQPEYGDFTSNAALMLAGPLQRPPRELAARIQAMLRDPDGVIERVEIAGPGFINIFLAHARWHDLLIRILREQERFGFGGDPGERVQVEFVSANPTGPLTIGHGRNAVLGDAIVRLLEATGHEVTREYYFNDGGRQMRVLGESLRARYQQQLGREAELPEDGYQGEYLCEIARTLAREQGDAWLDADWTRFKQAAEGAIFKDIRKTLERLEIHFDVYFNEHTLYADGHVETTLSDLRATGLVYEADGAVWLRTKELGLERDRVLLKSSGEPTYLLPDIAYHREKFRRGFERIIDVLGPDHIEQFPYVKAALGALGYPADDLEVVVYQWVNLRRGTELVKMSTRAASFVTVDEVVDEVGADVFRFFMLERRADTHFDFDLDLAKERSERNPVFKIQYAHARLCSIERVAVEREVELPEPEDICFARLQSPQELELVKRLERYPETLLHAARAREPQEVARYLLALATAFHSYVSDSTRHRVLSDDKELSVARLALVRAVRITLGNGLGRVGISAPERM